MQLKDFFKKNKQIILLLIIILLIFSYQKFNKKEITNDLVNFHIKEIKIFETSDWLSYTPKDTSGKFSISFPKGWKLDGSVFYNNKGEKIGEFSPGLVQLKENQSCFDTEWTNFSGVSELISTSTIDTGKLKGKSIIEKSEVWNGTTNDQYWYPYFYCLSSGNNAFVITFYEWKLEPTNEDMHNEILESFSF